MRPIATVVASSVVCAYVCVCVLGTQLIFTKFTNTFCYTLLSDIITVDLVEHSTSVIFEMPSEVLTHVDPIKSEE